MKRFLGANAFYADGISRVEKSGNISVKTAMKQKRKKTEKTIQIRRLTIVLCGGIYICVLVTAGGGMWMTTEEWMERANGLDDLIKEMQESYQKALDASCKMVSVPKRVCVQESKKNTSERNMVSVAVFSEMISTLISERYEIIAEIAEAIEQVPDNRLKTLLYARYINHKTWEQVAESVGVSDVWVRRNLREQALQEIEKILKS